MTTKTLSLVILSLLLTNNIFAEETLKDITIVSTNKTLQLIKNTTANISVITAEDIEENGYQTVAQAINHTSGIVVSKSGGLGQLTSIFTRGMNGGQTLVLLDGMRLNDPSTPNGAALLETFSIANISQIEIVKGGTSSIWGSNASAGVINIITKKAKDGLHGSSKIGYGAHHTKNGNIQLSYKNNSFTAQLQASKLKTNGISALAPRTAEKDGYENKNYNIKLGYEFDKNNILTLSYNNIKTDTQFDGSTAEDINVTGESKQKNYAINYTFTIDNYSTLLMASKSDIERNYTSISPFGSYSSGNNAVSKEYSFINQYSYGRNKAILGFEYKNIDGTFNSISSFDTKPTLVDTAYKNRTIFLSNLYYMDESTLLETNVRYDSFNKFDNKITYKIGLKHEHGFLEGFSTSTNYYTSYDAPSIFQLSAISPTITSLKPMYTKGFDISAGYKDFITLTYFKNTVEDAYHNVGNFSTPAYINQTGEEKFSGIEIETNYAFTELGLNLSANYTRLLTFEDNATNKLTRRPKEIINIALDHYTDNNTHIGINAQYIGDRKDIKYNPDFTTLEVTTGNYTLWNLNYGTDIIKDIHITIHAKNIFNKDYQSVFGYATEGRSIYMNVKYSF